MDQLIKDKLSEKLRYLRNKHGFSQEYMASAMGKNDHTAYQRLETGRTDIKLEDFVKISKIFNVALEELLNIDGLPKTRREEDYSFTDDIPFTIHLTGNMKKLEEQIQLARKLNEVLVKKK